MSSRYSQWSAMIAIAKGSFRSIFRSPSAVLFSIAFPLIFILVFGFIGNRTGADLFKIAVAPGSDSHNALFDSLVAIRNIRIVKYTTDAELQADLRKGSLTGVVSINKDTTSVGIPRYNMHFKSTTASADKYPQFLALVDQILTKISNTNFPDRPSYGQIVIRPEDIQQVRAYKNIDFVLPGQLGFSLLSAGVFGVAFLFFNLRQALVLKRFFATPINRGYIILGEGLSRVCFQLLTAVVIFRSCRSSL